MNVRNRKSFDMKYISRVRCLRMSLGVTFSMCMWMQLSAMINEMYFVVCLFF